MPSPRNESHYANGFVSLASREAPNWTPASARERSHRFGPSSELGTGKEVDTRTKEEKLRHGVQDGRAAPLHCFACATVPPPSEWRDINSAERERFIFHKVHVDTPYDPFTKRPYHHSILAVKVQPQTSAKRKTTKNKELFRPKNFSESLPFERQPNFGSFVSLNPQQASGQNGNHHYERVVGLGSIFSETKTNRYGHQNYGHSPTEERPSSENKNKDIYALFSQPGEITNDYQKANNQTTERHRKGKSKTGHKYKKRVFPHHRHNGKNKTKKIKSEIGNMRIRNKNQKPSRYLKRISQLDNFPAQLRFLRRWLSKLDQNQRLKKGFLPEGKNNRLFPSWKLDKT